MKVSELTVEDIAEYLLMELKMQGVVKKRQWPGSWKLQKAMLSLIQD